MNQAFSAAATSTIEGRIILTAENRTAQGFADALRDLQRFSTQAQRMQTQYVRTQRQQHRMHEQAQRDIEQTTRMAGGMFASFVTGVTAAAASVGIVMGNMAQAYREEVKNMAVWNERLKQNTKLSAQSLDQLSKDIAEFNRLPSNWDARRVMTATTRGAGDNAALIRRRTEAVIDIQTLLGGDADVLGTLNLMRTPRGAAAAVKLRGQLDPNLYKGYRSREWEQQEYEDAFKDSPEKAYNLLLSRLVADQERLGLTGLTRRGNAPATEENRKARQLDDIYERGGKEFNEAREAFLKFLNDMMAKFIPFFDSLSEANKQLVTFGLALAGVAGTLFSLRLFLRGLVALAGLGGGGGPRVVPVPGGGGPRVPKGPRLPLGAGNLLRMFGKTLGWAGLGFTAAEIIQMEAERLGGRDGSVPLTEEENRRAFDFDRGPVRRAPSGSGSAVRVRPPSNIPGFLLPGYGTPFADDPLATSGSYSGAGIGLSGVAVDAARPLNAGMSIGDGGSLSYFASSVNQATRGMREFNTALTMATFSLWGIRRRGGRGRGGRGGGAGGATGGTAGVGAPGGYPSMSGGIGMGGGINTGGGTGFGQYGAPGSEFTGGGGGGMGQPGTPDEQASAAQAMQYFQSQGWTREQAAGIVGNLFQESSFRVGSVGDNGASVGIAQWSASRRAAIAQHFGKPVNQMNYAEQLAAVQWEMTEGPEAAAGRRLRGARTAGEAGGILSQYYFRPLATQEEIVRRSGLAERFMGGAGGGMAGGTVAPNQSNRPSRYSGLISMDGVQYEYGSGGGRTSRGSSPIGTFPITPEANGPVISRMGGFTLNGNQIWDPKLGVMRGGIALHSGSSSEIDRLYSAGCFAVAKDQWPAFKRSLMERINQFGPQQLTINPDGSASINSVGEAPTAAVQRSPIVNATKQPKAGAGAVGGAPSVAATGPAGQLSGAPPFSVGKAVKPHPALPLHQGPTARLPRSRNGYTGQPPFPVPKGGAAGGSTALSGNAVRPSNVPPPPPSNAIRPSNVPPPSFAGNMPRPRPSMPGALAPATPGSVIRGGIISGGGLLNVTRNQDRSAMDFMGGGMDFGGLIGGGRNPLEGLLQQSSVQLGRGAVDITLKLAKQLQAAVPSVLPASHFDLGINVDRTGTNFSRPGDPAFPPPLSP